MWRGVAGWVRCRIWLLMVLAGVGLILSDRLAAWRPGSRPWLVRRMPDPTEPPTALEELPWPERAGDIVFPHVSFIGYGGAGSLLPDVAKWIAGEVRAEVEVNWRAFERAGISRQATV